MKGLKMRTDATLKAKSVLKRDDIEACQDKDGKWFITIPSNKVQRPIEEVMSPTNVAWVTDGYQGAKE